MSTKSKLHLGKIERSCSERSSGSQVSDKYAVQGPQTNLSVLLESSVLELNNLLILYREEKRSISF